MIVLKTSKKELFEKWLLWLDPILNLKEMDRRVLAAFLSLHYTYRSYQNHDILYDILFSETTKKDLAKRMDLSDSQLNKSIKSLEDKGLIIDNKIAPTLTKYPKDGKFKIQVYLDTTEPNGD
tara:strand:+ start:46671 stop:47036 length:366 start_codon:yes stop_codon:yes gene_type:complete